ncbi:post-transcriptional regulator [Saliterribacillus persicus]|uniref:ComN-like post-transcriptional regulator n=1 Tax=Saliterribacillus persicus TaxID=930114 RepID=A0A368XIZ0_9BACI|nr:post-transcriptional regulator [Saliterribacillus persicus]RCW66437.1 ComN-like post-transcriptional regulator [Saliterribacillus persicus]
MEEVKSVSEWKFKLHEILDSKVDEFKLLDYSNANKEDIWNCLVQKVWKGEPDKRLHQIVQDIFHLNPSIYMVYLTQQSLKDDNLQASLQALLGDQDY